MAKKNNKDSEELGNQDIFLTKTAENDENRLGVYNDDGKVNLIEHLIELRQRIIKSLLFILIIFLFLAFFSRQLYTLVSAPLTVFLPKGEMIATEVASPFLAPFKLSLFAAIFLSAPFILYQVWKFVAPALYRNEKRFAIPLLLSSIILFYLGIAFAYFVVFPLIFAFFTTIAPDGVKVMTDINSYLNFILKLFFAFGLAFEIPIATTLLIITNITTIEKLSAKRSYIIVGCFIIGMLLTPPDVFSQAMLAVPMWLLFELGLLNVKIIRFLATK